MKEHNFYLFIFMAVTVHNIIIIVNIKLSMIYLPMLIIIKPCIICNRYASYKSKLFYKLNIINKTNMIMLMRDVIIK